MYCFITFYDINVSVNLKKKIPETLFTFKSCKKILFKQQTWNLVICCYQ